MKKLSLFAMALLLVASISCNKDPDPNGNDNQDTDKITIGNYEGMIVTTYDSIDWDYFGNSDHQIEYGKRLSLNLNDDNIVFEVASVLSRNPIACLITDPLNYYTISISSDDIAFHYNMVPHEAYLHTDSTIIQTDSVTQIYIDEISLCNKISESDQYEPDYSYETEVLIQHEKNDVLNNADSFIYFTPLFYHTRLFQSNAVFPTQIVLDTTDVTIYENYTYAAEECLNFPLDEEFYLGFKFTGNNRERLGWIKLIIEPNENGHYCPKPLEAAIQE